MPWVKCPKGHKFGKEHDMWGDCDKCPDVPYAYCNECALTLGGFLKWVRGKQALTNEAKEQGWSES